MLHTSIKEIQELLGLACLCNPYIFYRMSTMILLGVLLQMLAFGDSTPPEIFYVRTTGFPFSDCPHQPCLTLHQYTQINNFTTGTPLQFLPGNHTLQESVLTLTSVSNITLRAESNSDVIIIFTNVVTILCKNVTNLKIEGLIFRLSFLIDYEITALKLINCHNVLILNTTFQLSADVFDIITGAMITQHSTATIRNSVFEGNLGDVIYILDESSLTICGSSFTRNKGLGNGDAVHAQESTLLLDGSTPNHFTHNSDDQKGGAIQCNYNCSLEMRGMNIFQSNYASVYNSGRGGAIFINHGKLLLSGTVIFSNNTASKGGAVYLEDCYITVDGEVEFIGNTADETGGGMCVYDTSVKTTNKGHMRFVNNRAGSYGAALKIEGNRENGESDLCASFLYNRVEISDLTGAVSAVSITSAQITFVNTNITGNINGALKITNSNITFSGLTRITKNGQYHVVNVYKSNITFSGSTKFTRNSGGVIGAWNSMVTFKGKTIIKFNNNNSPDNPNGGAIYCLDGKILFQGNTLFINNSASGDGGAVYAVSTSIYLQGIVNFTLNTASAMFLENGASLIFKQYTSLYTSYNTALKYGGGIYHEDSPTIRECNKATGFVEIITLPSCFLQEEHYVMETNTEISSLNDKAGIDGNFLYGGLIDRCKTVISGYYSTPYNWLTVHSQRNTRKEVTSKPYELCICNGNNCKRFQSLQVYRGQSSLFLSWPLLKWGPPPQQLQQ